MNKSSLLLFLAISTILISGSLAGNAYADPSQPPQSNPNLRTLWNAITNLQTQIDAIELTPGPQGPIGLTGPQGPPGNDGTSDPRADSFFDVFFDIFVDTPEKSAVDSFFDIFTELQTTNDAQQASIDSFFDIFTELQAADTQLQSNIDNEATARATADALLQTRVNENCAVGSSIRQINSDGSVLCEPDDVGTGSGGRLIVVERSGQTIDFSNGPFRTSLAQCLSGEIVVGGGYRTTDPRVNIAGESSTIFEGLPAWSVNAYSESGAGSITALAECARIAP